MRSNNTRIVSRIVLMISAVILLADCTNGSPPNHYVTTTGALVACPNAPHCVSSDAPADNSHYVRPFVFAGTGKQARLELLEALATMPHATRIEVRPRYIHTRFQTTLGFVDDVTTIIRPRKGTVAVRSASRIGYYDFGKNRSRITALRKRFDKRARIDGPLIVWPWSQL